MSKEGKAISSESSVGRATSQTDSVEDEHSLPPLIIRPQEDPPIQQGASEGESELHQEEVETHNRSITSPPPPSLDTSLEENRQVIAVSASKGPAAFFNLARKFLVTDEYCDLSALETAIVSAVDAAHLLERSKLATIVSVQTSYVKVETRRRGSTSRSTRHQSTQSPTSTPNRSHHRRSKSGGESVKEVRRARIVITVKRTEDYRVWLEENPLPLHEIMGTGDDDDGVTSALSP